MRWLWRRSALRHPLADVRQGIRARGKRANCLVIFGDVALANGFACRFCPPAARSVELWCWWSCKFGLRRGGSPGRPRLREGTGKPQISSFVGRRHKIIVQRPDRGLCSVLHSYPPKKPFHVNLHCLLGDVEFACDDFVRVAIHQAFKDHCLAVRGTAFVRDRRCRAS